MKFFLNKISNHKSIYEIYDEEYPDLTIDGIFQDQYFEKPFSDFQILGLMPPFGGWLSGVEDELFFCERILPFSGETRVAPILIRPDVQDFSCMTIVVLVEQTDYSFRWKRFGLDRSNLYPYRERLDEAVDWFE
ncbi:hypothetical protein [Leptospira sanjuanensis]|uniref:hypothetical protein n=1 Tax=Leptospira sanjuanensis TaxID=2879643 RepID=UPI001EE87E57|nr:hypothetical protein [Leptospira sanjuanensis]MCG6167125.1 hypothetical protein [Leptospira sanjuanensis]